MNESELDEDAYQIAKWQSVRLILHAWQRKADTVLAHTPVLAPHTPGPPRSHTRHGVTHPCLRPPKAASQPHPRWTTLRMP